jgi:hypothetical protein
MVNAVNSYKNHNNSNLKPALKRTIKGKIRDLHVDDKEQKAADVLKELKKWAKHEYGDIRLPSLRTVQQTIYDYEHPKKPEEKILKEELEKLKAPWHMGMNYSLTPIGIAKIFEIKSKLGWDDMTFHQAQWVDRLSALPLSLEALKLEARMYAYYERMAKLTGIPYDFKEHDNKAIIVMLKSEDGGKAIAEKIAEQSAEAIGKMRELKLKREVKNERSHSSKVKE